MTDMTRNPSADSTELAPYIGRFAPSPTGKLHAGSLLAALASYLDAKANNGIWLVRMEDLDPPREEPGAAQAILDCLQAHDLFWDGHVIWQSQRHDLYQQALEQLIANHKAYPCSCSRQELAKNNGLHLGRCNNHQGEVAWRFACDDQTLSFQDLLLSKQSIELGKAVGDFVIKRKDGLFAYQLAVVVDDYLQGITHVVRGNDLLDSSFRQIILQQNLFDFSDPNKPFVTPQYCHLPVLVDNNGDKLSKQTFAPEINTANARKNLITALEQLHQPLPPEHMRQSCRQILEWAIEHWQLKNVGTEKSIPAL